MTARQRQVLLDRPIAILNYRICHAQKRWGGVFVNDYFGEGSRALAHKRQKGNSSGVGSLNIDDVTKFSSVISLEDYALWERMADNDQNI